MKTKTVVISILFVGTILSSCSSPTESEQKPLFYSNEIFSIYIVEDTLYGKSEVGLDTLKLSKQPLLSSSDIVSYSWSKHQITYSEDVYERLMGFTDLWRKGFVIIAEGKKIYWGLFQSHVDSYACQNPVIFLYPSEPDMKHILTPAIFIRRSYFDREGLETEPDPRSDTRIYNALEKAGILIP